MLANSGKVAALHSSVALADSYIKELAPLYEGFFSNRPRRRGGREKLKACLVLC